MRKNKSQRNQRRANLHANLPRLSVDTETGSTHLRHRVDLKTGMYRGRQVLQVNSNKQQTTNPTSPKASQDTATNDQQQDSDTTADAKNKTAKSDKKTKTSKAAA